MLKPVYLISVLSSIFISSLPLFQNVAMAQEQPGCFIINSEGKVSSLDPLCKKHNEEQKLRNVMKAQELYQQGFDRGRRGLYKEAIADYNQAINLNPDFAEAYVSRAIVRYLTEDKQGGVEDLQKAIAIYKARGKSEIADMLLGRLQEFQQDIQMGEEL